MQIEGNVALITQTPVNITGDRTIATVAGNVKAKGQVETSPQQPSESSLVDLLKQGGADVNFQLSFSIDKGSKELVVKVINPVTNEVIRQIPPQELLNLAANLQQTAGILVNKRV
ncbi:MAG: flagellar protein FlaG [Thermacetogeniaceae bacterium]